MSQFNITMSKIYPLFKSTGVYVEVGGSHPFEQNNTYELENAGWSGLVIEPLPIYNELYRTRRPRTFVENYAIVEKEEQESVSFLQICNCTHGSGVADLKNNPNHHLSREQTKTIDVPCCTLRKLLQKHNINHIDFLSIDTEGYEHHVLSSIDFAACHINTILIEDHGEHIYKQF